MKKNKDGFKFGLAAAFMVVTITLTVLVMINYNAVHDFLSSIFYIPSSEKVEDLEKELDLTYNGQLVFKASRPVVDDSQNFNSSCGTTDLSAPVLGCYENSTIHIYNIEEPALTGIMESTAAHELAHAIWARMSDGEKKALEPVLEEVYNKNSDSLAVLSEYAKGARTDELFARAATEIKNVPSELEKIYADYFVDRSKIVSFFDNYYSVFKDLNDKLKSLLSEIESLQKSIETESEDYTTRSNSLKVAIEEFNNCAETQDCYDYSTFATRRTELTNEQEALKALYGKIKSEIARYYERIDEYNKNVFKTIYYEGKINSNL